MNLFHEGGIHGTQDTGHMIQRKLEEREQTGFDMDGFVIIDNYLMTRQTPMESMCAFSSEAVRAIC